MKLCKEDRKWAVIHSTVTQYLLAKQVQFSYQLDQNSLKQIIGIPWTFSFFFFLFLHSPNFLRRKYPTIVTNTFESHIPPPPFRRRLLCILPCVFAK